MSNLPAVESFGSKRTRSPIWVGVTLVLLAFFAVAYFVTTRHEMTWCGTGPGVQSVHALVFSMYAYANDNHGTYPDGKSSTEVFQKLMDGGYCIDPSIFFLPLPGKIKGIPGQKLKPENVCFDVTSGVNSSSSDDVPIVFETGYKITYTPGASAVPLARFAPKFFAWPRIWSECWRGTSVRYATFDDGVPVAFKNNASMFKTMNRSSRDSIPNFISPDFKSDGYTYSQLTPDGVLPP